MQDNLDKALAFVLKWEGGLVDNPNDAGGVTKYGISQRAHPHLDVRNLTLEDAKEIYRVKYWEAIQGDDRPFHEALAIFDFAVHSGVHRAMHYWTQTQDVEEYLVARLEFLASLKDFDFFGRGWIRRVADLTRIVERELHEQAKSPDIEIIQLYYQDQTYTFYPTKSTVGVSSSGRTKLMARLR